MEAVIIIYFTFTGVTYASFCYNTEDSIWGNLPVITMAFLCGWYVTPALLGRIIKQKYEDSEEEMKGEKE